ncbi:MAG: PLP-dependent lyase/thiolase [Myxococcales bacterium]|nr:PLP-dependent lyase/thiolase [Myxococcales bacterium]MCB9712545.1 PLP-dependent lyase/thiolase [Myxococcales bacterium]
METKDVVWIECSGCGQRVPLTEPHPFACPARREGDDVDHVLVRQLEARRVRFPTAPRGNPYLDFAELMTPLHRAHALGVGEVDFRRMVKELDDAVAEVDGQGFRPTPWMSLPELAAGLGDPRMLLWAKDETTNVGGSHKARHLMGVMIHLRLAELAGLADPGARPPLAIASCGNAALGAAVVARAARWPLRVFVPTDAEPAVLERLHALAAEVHPCPRDDQPGDPSVRAFRAALREGALPFSVQGSDNGMAVEGGLTLGYELAEQVRTGPGRLDVLVVQVGGGALASACLHALRDAVALGVLPAMPRLCTVQTHGAYPLHRAYEAIASVIQGTATPPADARARADWLQQRGAASIDAALRHAATHRSAYMWPWELEPHSVAHGILDDETYDWWALCEGMIHTGGWPEVVDEDTLIAAREAVALRTEVTATATATAGVAGVLAMRRAGRLRPGEVVGTLLTGVVR